MSSEKKTRAVKEPQRSNGKQRVAAILQAAAELIDEKGYDNATMAEIAARSGTQIGSLYRFFPNKESLADTIVDAARDHIEEVFARFDFAVKGMSVRSVSDALLDAVLDVFHLPGFRKILDTGEWSAKRDEFRSALLQRIVRSLRNWTQDLPERTAKDMATIFLLNGKTLAQESASDGPSGVGTEFRDMTFFYLQKRVASLKKHRE